MNITEFRQKYPQYDSLSDQELGDKLYNKYYSDKLDRSTFDQRFGLSNQQKSQQPEQGAFASITDKIVNNPLMQGIYGAGDAFANIMSLGVGPKHASEYYGAGNPESLAYNAGTIGGDVLAAALPAGLATQGIKTAIGLGRLGAGVLPYASLLSNIASGTAVGAASNPENRTSGALLGAMLGGVFGSIPFIRPGKTLKLLKNQFSEKNVANKISEGIKLYDEAIEPHSNEVISDIGRYTKNFTKRHIGNASNVVEQEYKNFLESPTIKNAMSLKRFLNKEFHTNLLPKQQSAIKGLNSVETKRFELYPRLNAFLKTDITSKLQEVNPEAASKFAAAETNWAKNVAPSDVTRRIISNVERNPLPFKRQSTRIAGALIKSPQKISPEALKYAKNILKQQKTLNAVIGGGLLAEELLSGGAGIKKLIHHFQ